MPQTFDVASGRASLRQRATAQLNVGASTDLKPATMSEALTVLHQLASSPSTAGDALALLHELQVHQVELDMQQEELRQSRSELEAALSHQTALVDHAPTGFMTIDAGTVLREINPAGARLLGAAPDELLGRPLVSLLDAPSAAALQSLIARARDGLMPQTCELRLAPLAGVIRSVHATAGKATMPECFVLALMSAAMPA